MKNRFNYLLVLVLTFSSNILISQNESKNLEEKFVKNFISGMKNGNDVRSMISNEYIKENHLEKIDWQSNFLLIKNYKIQKIQSNTFFILIDHGNGNYCTSIELNIIIEKGQYKILPSEIIYVEKLKLYFVTPWKNKIKSC
jgi:hypothetical protein